MTFCICNAFCNAIEKQSRKIILEFQDIKLFKGNLQIKDYSLALACVLRLP